MDDKFNVGFKLGDHGFYDHVRRWLAWLSGVRIDGIPFAYFFLVHYKSLKPFKLGETSLNQKIENRLEANSNEINLLIKAYNGMVDELEKNASN
jgi:hypothetical protein